MHDVRLREHSAAEDGHEQRHHRHAAADAEQAGKKADDCAEDHERRERRDVHGRHYTVRFIAGWCAYRNNMRIAFRVVA